MKSGSRPTVFTEFGGGCDVAIRQALGRLVAGRPHELASSEWTTRAGEWIAAFLSVLSDISRATASHCGNRQIGYPFVLQYPVFRTPGPDGHAPRETSRSDSDCRIDQPLRPQVK
jgi:hypothetical protein